MSFVQLYVLIFLILLPLLFDGGRQNDKPKAYTSFNRRFLITEKLRIIKYAEENSIYAASNINIAYHKKQYNIWFNRKNS